jgi:hypothetical protein
MVPLKEAINIFEKHKINKIKNDNPLLYKAEGSISPFSSTNYILEKIRQEKFEIYSPQDDIKIAGKSLLKLVSKKYYIPNRDPSIGEGLQLYGKAHTEITETPYGNNGIEFEKIYLNFYADTFLNMPSQEIEIDVETGKSTVINKVPLDDWVNEELCDLFENYDYDSLYNPSINYTVMGSWKENKIRYTDISVKLDELMELINREFNTIPSEYTPVIDDMVSKYGDTINKVWKQTRELHDQVHILKINYVEIIQFYNEYRLDIPKELIQGRLESESFNKYYRETKSYEKDLDAFFKEDIELQKEFNNEIDVFLCKLNPSKYIDHLIIPETNK